MQPSTPRSTRPAPWLASRACRPLPDSCEQAVGSITHRVLYNLQTQATQPQISACAAGGRGQKSLLLTDMSAVSEATTTKRSNCGRGLPSGHCSLPGLMKDLPRPLASMVASGRALKHHAPVDHATGDAPRDFQLNHKVSACK